MSHLFRWFRNFEYIDKAIGIWTEADNLIAQLQSLGQALHRSIAQGTVAQTKEIVTSIVKLDAELTIKEDAFSASLRDASEWAQGLLVVVILVFAVVAGAICGALLLWIARITATVEAYGRDLAEKNRELSRQSEELAEKGADLANRNWLADAQNSLNQRLSGEQSASELCDRVLGFLADHLEASVGAFYVAGQGDTLEREGAYGFAQADSLRATFQLGEGLVGQTAKEKRPVLVSPVPSEYIKVNSGLGASPPRHLLVHPIVHEGTAIGVLELGTFTPFTELQRTFLDQAAPSIAVALEMLHSRNRRHADAS